MTDLNFKRQGTVRIFYSAFFILIFLIPKNSASQYITQNEIPSRLQLKNSIAFETKKEPLDKPELAEFKMKKSPLRAAIYSAVLPGAGQYYNESYWKIPIIAGLGGYFVYKLIDNNNQYKDYNERFLNSVTPENPFGDQQLKSNRDFYRDQRDNFIIYSAILYIINVADAFVDAHLYDFDVSDEMRFGLLKKGKLVEMNLRF